jgi:CDP-diacylglycerol pyrophosphatase
MKSDHSRDVGQGGFFRLRIALYAAAVLVAVCGYANSGLILSWAAQRDLPPNTLWEVVRNLCVPGQADFHDPQPCAEVDLEGGIEKGFAILRDPRGGTQFLLIPTRQIPGIESPIVREEQAANYFARAWEARKHIGEALHQDVPRDAIGLAINSAVSRSQGQLHIHISCIRPAALDALRKNERKIGEQWSLLDAPLAGHRYIAMWITADDLSGFNVFRMLADKVPAAAQDMGDRTLVVVGMTRKDGTRGFVLLSNEVNKETGDQAFGEELLDRDCHIVAKGHVAQNGQ